MLEHLIHRWLRIPYTLHSAVISPKKPVATVVFIHGIGNSSESWNEVIEALPDNVKVISVDLLGFGKSPRPSWATYNAFTQARSVVRTLLGLSLRGRVILVGHSLGALVAVETAQRYPVLVKSLILCSPPFYDAESSGLIKSDQLLTKLYRRIQAHPEEFVKLSALAMKYKLTNRAFNVTDENVDTYMHTLEAAIINQTSLDDAIRLKKPMTIFHGALDPLVIKRNLKQLVAVNPRAHLITLKTSSHEVGKRYAISLTNEIARQIAPPGDDSDLTQN
jgi:pimeloyl-ACP methyl ester carboxylesterase